MATNTIRMRPAARRAVRSAFFALLLFLLGTSTAAASSAHEGPGLGESLPLWSTVPFLGILLSIALFPLFAPHFWHNHYPKVSAAWALLLAVPFVAAYRSQAIDEMIHIYLLDYIPFIILLWSLYTVSGGIVLTGTLSGTPTGNLVLLLAGTVMASMIGTTGASMLLIRPLLKANTWRRHRVHLVIFFIFLVSNIGGALTPLGDPPLFLGFLNGVPFFWTLHLFPFMAFVAGLLLVVFFAMDTFFYRRDRIERPNALDSTVPEGGIPARPAGMPESGAAQDQPPLRLVGKINFLFLAGIVTAVLLSGILHLGEITFRGTHILFQNVLRDVALILMGLLSLRFTARQLRTQNGFTWFPIQEVAYLFAGIFMTIIPALAILRAGTHGSLAFLIESVRTPMQYFWTTGGLSSFLDNAPTYLTFFNSALGSFYPGEPVREAVHTLIAERQVYLEAISAGAVFLGAMTYIGNAPNFMVRSIALEHGVTMPSFFGYMLRYSVLILIPVFFLGTLIFL